LSKNINKSVEFESSPDRRRRNVNYLEPEKHGKMNKSAAMDQISDHYSRNLDSKENSRKRRHGDNYLIKKYLGDQNRYG